MFEYTKEIAKMENYYKMMLHWFKEESILKFL